MHSIQRGLALIVLAVAVFAATALRASTDTSVVKLDNATISGPVNGTIQRFLGIPYAKPPIGDLRLRLPQSVPAYTKDFNATSYGPACIQQPGTFNFTDEVLEALGPELAALLTAEGEDPIESEDCLSINVIRPATATSRSKLPVVVWMYGGGFAKGHTAEYDGGKLVARSVELKTPVIYVSMNYRLSALGFLGGKEVEEASVGNLGLHDQKEALRWVKKYVNRFGGDSAKVTVWGESAGAISIALHMLTDEEKLFRGAFMQSGAPLSLGHIKNGQGRFDDFVKNAGCSGATDPLSCLRLASSDDIRAAVQKGPDAFSDVLHQGFIPRVDGQLLKAEPFHLVKAGKGRQIPYVTGNCDDEGTLFSLKAMGVTTDSEFESWLKEVYLPATKGADIKKIATLYPSDPSAGSPFDTGTKNALTPQFKRIAAVQGDVFFHSPRRWQLDNTVATGSNAWFFLSKRMKDFPVFGSMHASDIFDYGGGELSDYLISFATTLNPNGLVDFHWPKYTLHSRETLLLQDGDAPLALTKDDYRKEAIQHMIKVHLAGPYTDSGKDHLSSQTGPADQDPLPFNSL